jgi:hypothetical protein
MGASNHRVNLIVLPAATTKNENICISTTVVLRHPLPYFLTFGLGRVPANNLSLLWLQHAASTLIFAMMSAATPR